MHLPQTGKVTVRMLTAPTTGNGSVRGLKEFWRVWRERRRPFSLGFPGGCRRSKVRLFHRHKIFYLSEERKTLPLKECLSLVYYGLQPIVLLVYYVYTSVVCRE